MKKLALALALFVTPALAQPQAPQEYVPPDQELWAQMSQAFSNLNMPLTAHQQVQQIMQNVEQASRQRAKKLQETKPDAK